MKDQQHATPGKGTDPNEALRESQLTVPETPSPDRPSDTSFGVKKKETVMDMGARKRHARIVSNGKNSDISRNQNGGLLFGVDYLCSKSVSSYSDICSIAAQHFARIQEVLIVRNVLPSALKFGFLTPCRERLVVALALDLFAVNDEKFMDMFVAPGAIDVLHSERQSLHKRQKILQSYLNEFKNIARAL